MPRNKPTRSDAKQVYKTAAQHASARRSAEADYARASRRAGLPKPQPLVKPAKTQTMQVRKVPGPKPR